MESFGGVGVTRGGSLFQIAYIAARDPGEPG
jgi:hypothetical protein